MPLKAKLGRTLRSVWRPLGRARRSRGFGVHSPFAFRFITFVLRGERNIYYSTSKITTTAGNRYNRRRLGLLFRIICDRQPQTLVIPAGTLSETERSVIALADSRLQPINLQDMTADLTAILPAEHMLLFLPAFKTEHIQTARHILHSENSTLILFDITPQELSVLTDSIDHIMIFTNRKAAVIVSRHDLPRQNFEINF